MTDDPSPSPSPAPSIEDVVKEMQEQYATLKDSFEKANAEKDGLIEALKKQNEELSRAVVRSAFTSPAPEEKEPTEEDVYAQRINAIFEKSKKLKR